MIEIGKMTELRKINYINRIDISGDGPSHQCLLLAARVRLLLRLYLICVDVKYKIRGQTVRNILLFRERRENKHISQ